MKKGCFIKTIAALTIFTAVIAYIIQYKLDDWIIKPVKKIVMPVLEESLTKELSFVKDSPEKDSLLNQVSYYIKNYNFIEKNDSLKEGFWIKLKSISSDSIITTSELEEIKKFLENENEK